MSAILTTIYTGFAIAMASLIGLAVYEWAERARWVKSPGIFSFIAAAAAAMLLLKYGWPIYSTLVIKVFT